MGKNMCYSFDDLFRAARQRGMTLEEAEQFNAMSQAEKNHKVKQLVAETNGVFTCEDRIGTDGQTYTAFEKKI